MLLLTALTFLAGCDAVQHTELVGVNNLGAQPQDACMPGELSADGRFVLLQSAAGNLVPGDSNGIFDVFVHDRLHGKTERVSVNSQGLEADRASYAGDVSADGRYVVFTSWATNLVTPHTGAETQVYLHDRASRTTILVSRNSAGERGNRHSGDPAISPDGRWIVFESFAENFAGDLHDRSAIFRHDRLTGATEMVSMPISGPFLTGDCSAPSVSADGQTIAYHSYADNLVPADLNGVRDVFLTRMPTRATVRVQATPGGAEPNGSSGYPVLSDDGAAVAFHSLADNLVPGDTNLAVDVFVLRLAGWNLSRASVGVGGVQADAGSTFPRLSSDGRVLAFSSEASNLVAGDTNGHSDAFVRELATATTRLASVGSNGERGNGASRLGGISPDARVIAFVSEATNFAPPPDANAKLGDAFVRSAGPLLDVGVLQAGQLAELRLGGAHPGAALHVLLSRTGAGPTPSGHGFDLQLSPPLRALPQLTAGLDGRAGLLFLVPAQLPPGSPVWWQAVERHPLGFAVSAPIAAWIL